MTLGELRSAPSSAESRPHDPIHTSSCGVFVVVVTPLAPGISIVLSLSNCAYRLVPAAGRADGQNHEPLRVFVVVLCDAEVAARVGGGVAATV